MSPAIDVNAVGGGFGSEGAVLLDKVSHGLLDVIFTVPLFLLLFLLLLLGPVLLDRGGRWRRKFCLSLNFPHCRQGRVAASSFFLTLSREIQGVNLVVLLAVYALVGAAKGGWGREAKGNTESQHKTQRASLV